MYKIGGRQFCVQVLISIREQRSDAGLGMMIMLPRFVHCNECGFFEALPIIYGSELGFS